MKKEDANRKEFYESKTWYILFAIFFIFLIALISLDFWKADDFDWNSVLLPFCGGWIGFILYMHSLLVYALFVGDVFTKRSLYYC